MLQLHQIRKSYTTANFTQTALDGVTVAFRDNEFAAVLGPSGSGKTTMLNIIGGLDHYDSGDIEIDGISTKKYKDRDWDTYRNNRIGFVFQSYNLIPHQSVLANVELALTLSGVQKAERRARARQALAEVGLEDHIHKKPSQLSGGQMQRVAIARALINDPEILLADEPTGALDTQTGRQVMELLTRIAKDRLVIMVTHNSELAEQYANRIIHLKDGQVVSDSRPFRPFGEICSGRAVRRASMSFLTAISLSFSNLMTKKGRTFMTALAGSIGIIGIAVILALATGINAYIKNVEEDTLSLYPLTIQSAGFDLMRMFGDFGHAERSEEEAVEPDGVREWKIVNRMFARRSKNDLAALKTYFDENAQEMDRQVNLIHYMYDITPQIYLADTSGGVEQVNPDSILGGYGMSSGGGMGMSMGFAGMSGMNMFHEMPGDRRLYEGQYDVLAGHWPESHDQAVLVLAHGNSITDYLLYSMGLRDRSELKAMVESFMNKEETSIASDEAGGLYSYDTLMSAAFKIIHPADRYQYDETYQVWVDKSGDKAYMKSLVDKGCPLRIVGIVQPNSSSASLSSGINYSSDLIAYLIEQSAGKKVIRDQLAQPTVNVLTGKTFAEEMEDLGSEFDFSKIISVDEEAFRSAMQIDASDFDFDLSNIRIGGSGFNFDPSAFDLDPSLFDIDLSSLGEFPPGTELPEFSIDMAALLRAIAAEVNVPVEELRDVMYGILRDFLAEQAAQGITDPIQILANLAAYLSTPEVQAELSERLAEIVDPSMLQEQVMRGIQAYMQTMMQAYMAQMLNILQAQIQAQIQQTMQQVMVQAMQQILQTITSQIARGMRGAAAQIQRAIEDGLQQMSDQMKNIDGAALVSAFQINMGEEDILALMASVMNPSESSYERNLSLLGYADPATPSQINLYPRNFESKKEALGILDRYNERMEWNGEPDKVIQYTDFVGVLMSSVTDIVDLVSYALIAFVAISLVVSSIMIGVITFISVLERKKEIGILRAIGASKQNIRLVFNAETLIVGFVSGVLGVVVSLLISSIGSAIVYNEFDIAGIAQLPILAVFILIAVSMFLTFIAGLLPASAAARKDPVEALRAE
ncbi:MAG: ABC transporter ATP-binding protein/permease [Clostridiales bacterium]|nr:ABC transporter ATP-binding protein/permease [Clostridiales bacterium]